MLKPADDTDLAAQAVRGDREAFGRLLERNYDTIYRLAYRYTGSVADGEDITQDICVGLASKLAQFRGGSRFSTWLYAVVLNACRDFSRRRKSSATLVDRYGAQRLLDDGDQADSAERRAWLVGALAALEPTLRETVILVIDEELSHADAAEVLGCAEKTVSWRMHEARRRLRALRDYDNG